MASEAPPFWWQEADWRARLLSPFSLLYGTVARGRLERAPRTATGLPVLCVGNFTVGGAGKTPVAIALAEAAKGLGFSPGFVSRGHGGSFSAPHRVDAVNDAARHTGDEPLLLARAAPTVVSPDREAAARMLREEGCDFIVMDDGFQSARIRIDYALIVVDAFRGVGNGHVIPGGPLRAPLTAQLTRTDALLKLGRGNAADAIVRRAARAGRPVYDAVVASSDPGAIAGRRFLAFAGIGSPEKFFETVREAGGEVAATRSFADHHLYRDDDLADLAAAASVADATLVTTAKDAVRLRHGSPAARAFSEQLSVLEIETLFEVASTPRRLIEATLESFRRRQFG